MQAKYDKIGVNYNQTRRADGYLVERLFYHLNPLDGGLFLDIGCGTGNYTNQLQQKGLNFIGIDPSKSMLEKAKAKNKKINWRIGQAENTRLKAESIDGIIGSLTIHHWSDLQGGFIEMNRILKTDGNLVIFTSTPKQMEGYWLNYYFPKMLQDSMVQMPAEKRVIEKMKEARFFKIKKELYSIKPNLKDLFLYSGKHYPEIYLIPEVRNGISSFSALANQKEVKEGLEKLTQDINTGKIKEIMKSYENDLGDYLYIIGKKN